MAEAVGVFGLLVYISIILIVPLIFFTIAIFSIVFWIMMLIDVIQRDFANDNDKIMWVLVLVFAGIIGATIYYFMIKKKS